MAKKISQLTQATEVKSDDVTVIVQDGETKKLPLNMMVTKQDIENKKVAGIAKLDEIEATYENDTYTPTITVENKSSVKTGEGDEVDYSANVMDGHVKSAILKGQTLVNLSQSATFKTETGARMKRINLTYQSKENEKLLLKINVTKCEAPLKMRFEYGDGTNSRLLNDINNVGCYTFIISHSSGIVSFYPYIDQEPFNNGLNVRVEDINIIKYQDGMENWDIPYFEGMQSVKLPVLKTTGKNLFSCSLMMGVWDKIQKKPILNDKYFCTTDLIRVRPNTIVKVSGTAFNPEVSGNVFFYDKDKNYLGDDVQVWALNKAKIPSNAHYMAFHFGVSYLYDINGIVQIEIVDNVSSPTTTYEPHKSNILSTSEDVVLRGIGDVKDTLDLITGEVTERVGEIVLDGSENWDEFQIYSDFVRARIVGGIGGTRNSNGNGLLTNSSLTPADDFPGSSNYEKIGTHSNGNFYILLSKNKLSDISMAGFKNWLAQNPITVQYKLATESVKTVDLMPSGTHPSTTPYCWKDGHIQLSSSGLLPNLEYSVVTSRAGQINQNATMIVKNDKRIFDLEILLAGGLVNTTYQALTLQNQVETGLSKASLNSETEPDYLLYHMIMKLIEEKAYKLDDLTEKVSVFYLYEKLSDEQFETIYSALYPFVEDEIVEEPVVEELPEVAEDEVIM